jgi:hypothetical protein
MDGQLQILSAAWSLAARDLSIELVAPFRVGKRGGDIAVALVPLFGSPAGTLVDFREGTSDAARRHAGAHGCHYSQIYFDAYATYERALWQETLNDWGWYGPLAEAPSWFSGITYGM